METPMVSLSVVAYNAQVHLGALLNDIRAQTYPFDRMELLLIDSGSSDGTRAMMEAFCKEAAGWETPLTVRVLDNPGRILACGWNVALDAYTGDALLRVDAHASIPPGFIEANARALAQGHDRDVVGGQVASLPPRFVQEAPLVALDTSRFAGGAAAFRNAGSAREVDALAYPLVRRRVYEQVGRYDERLVRTEDNDMAWRMRQAGFRLWYTPQITSHHRARSTLGGQLGQKWRNGHWVGLSLLVSPRGFSARHFAPMLFVLALLCAGGLFAAGWRLPLIALGAVYALCDAVFTIQAARASPVGKARCLWSLPWMFLLVHLCYGAGTLAGLPVAYRIAKKQREE
ncbi:MAG: glycosyltransferase family 2 protein [Clostridia bacterium]|nr:glycosyltransferase family 2 protein [Clostridia bacterium]